VAASKVSHLSGLTVEVARVVPVPSTPELVLWLQAICHCVVLVELLNPTVPEELLSKHGEEQSSSKAQDDTLLPVTSDAI